jgi:hypothetical protein
MKNLSKSRKITWLARIWSLGPLFFIATEIFFPHDEPTASVHWTEWIPVILLFSSVAGLAVAWINEELGALITLTTFVAFFASYWLISGEMFPVSGLLVLFNVVGPAFLFLYVARNLRMAQAHRPV